MEMAAILEGLGSRAFRLWDSARSASRQNKIAKMITAMRLSHCVENSA